MIRVEDKKRSVHSTETHKGITLSPPQWNLFKRLEQLEGPLSIDEVAEEFAGGSEAAARSLVHRLKLSLEEIGEGERLHSIRSHGYVLDLE